MKPANTNGGGLPTMVADMAVTERFEETHFRDQQRIKTLFRLVAQGDKEGIANMVRNRGSGRVVRQQDFAGWSCLHTAAYHGKAAVISVLIDAGASVDTKSIVGRTALHYAADQGNGKTVAQLLIAGVCTCCDFGSPHLWSRALICRLSDDLLTLVSKANNLSSKLGWDNPRCLCMCFWMFE
eukprot:m.458916 g.458916  ORF g.458916 m.458916 type:complete len:182 (+) comp21582_c0_seq45:127-672(+)